MGTKGENTKKTICREAAKLFSKKGFKDVSMQDICNATGLSKGGLYRHFGSKEEILANHTYNAQQIEWFKAGGALNIIRANQA